MKWVMPRTWMRHVPHMNESCHAYEWVMSHIHMSHATHINNSDHMYEWFTSRICMSHVTHTRTHTETCISWAIRRAFVASRRASFTSSRAFSASSSVTSRFSCTYLHSYLWHDVFICVTWIILCVTWILHMRVLQCVAVCCIVLQCVAVCCSLHMSETNYSYEWEMTPPYVGNASFVEAFLKYFMNTEHVWHEYSCDIPLS